MDTPATAAVDRGAGEALARVGGATPVPLGGAARAAGVATLTTLPARPRVTVPPSPGLGGGAGGGATPRDAAAAPRRRERAAADMPTTGPTAAGGGGSRGEAALMESATDSSNGAFTTGALATKARFSMTRCWNMGLDATSPPS